MDLLAKLGIHWTQIIAQVINFVVIAGVLTYFVYRPLLNVIDARRERIQKAMDDAKRVEEQQKTMKDEQRRALDNIDQQAGAILEEAKKRGEEVRQDMITKAQKEVEEIHVRAKKQIEEERAAIFGEVEKSLTSMILQMTQKILEREFTPDDQKRLVIALEKELPKNLR